MNQSAIARLEAAAAAGQDLQLSQDPAFSSMSAGSTKCLALAAGGGHLSTVQLLLNHKAYTPDAPGFSYNAAWRDLASALVAAARHGHLEVAGALLMVPTNADDSIAGDMTDGAALDAAAAGGHRAVVQLLCSTIPQQDVVCMKMRPILKFLLAWDSRHAAQQGWSSFAWYSRIRMRLVLLVQSLTIITVGAWILAAFGWLPIPPKVRNHPLYFIVWSLLQMLYSFM